MEHYCYHWSNQKSAYFIHKAPDNVPCDSDGVIDPFEEGIQVLGKEIIRTVEATEAENRINSGNQVNQVKPLPRMCPPTIIWDLPPVVCRELRTCY